MPPPATTNKYGDANFVTETWQSSTPDSPTTYVPGSDAGRPPLNYPQGPMSYPAAYTPAHLTPFHQPPPPAASPPGGAYFGGPPQPPPYGGAPNYTYPGQPTAFANQAVVPGVVTLTPEDRLFVQNWWKEFLFKSVLPNNAAALGGVYLFNRMKQRPHKFWHYMGAAFLCDWVCFVWGSNDFRKRLAETTINSPAMSMMRRAYGIAPKESDNQFLSGYDGSYTGAAYAGDAPQSLNWSTSRPSSQPTPGAYPPQPPAPVGGESTDSSQSAPGSLSPLVDSNDPNAPRQPTLTYDDLRARNRGQYGARIKSAL